MATNMSLPGLDLMKGIGLGPLNVGNVLDTMGYVKKAWGAMNAPSAFMPTIDVEELKKRIVDLQAVEQWLVMNLGMIQSSIQALEVQRATIETLKGVTKGFVVPVVADLEPAPVEKPKARTKPRAPKSSDPLAGASTWLEFLQGQFNQVTQAAMSGSPLKATKNAAKGVAKKAMKSAVNQAVKGVIQGGPTKGATKRSTAKPRSTQ
jgi:hypothetical protein